MIKPISAIALITIVALLYFLDTRPIPANSLLWSSIQDTGHIPLFGIISLSLLAMLKNTFTQRYLKIKHQYLLALMISLILAALSEWSQAFDPKREPDLMDFLFDLVGSLTFLFVFSLYDPRIACNKMPDRKKRYRKLALVLIVWIAASTPLLSTLTAYQYRNDIFPRLIDASNNKSLPFIHINDGSLVMPSPSRHTQEHPGLKWDSTLNTDWPFIRINEPVTNWQAYSQLILDITLTSDHKARLTLRADDQYFTTGKLHTLETHAILSKGHNRVVLELDKHPLPTGFFKHLIRHVWLALPDPQQRHSFYITGLYLQ